MIASRVCATICEHRGEESVTALKSIWALFWFAGTVSLNPIVDVLKFCNLFGVQSQNDAACSKHVRGQDINDHVTLGATSRLLHKRSRKCTKTLFQTILVLFIKCRIHHCDIRTVFWRIHGVHHRPSGVVPHPTAREGVHIKSGGASIGVSRNESHALRSDEYRRIVAQLLKDSLSVISEFI